MVNLSHQEFAKQFAQHARLSSSQIEAASLCLSGKGASIAYCQKYALGEAYGLSFGQWAKVKQFIQQQQVFEQLPETAAASLLQIRRFLPYDMSLKQHISMPQALKAYDSEKLIAFVNQLLARPNQDPLQLLQETFEGADAQLLSEMKAAVLLKLIETPQLLQTIREWFYLNCHVALVTNGTKSSEAQKTLVNEWPKPAPDLKKLDPALFLRFWSMRNQGHFRLQFSHAQGEQTAIDMMTSALGCTTEHAWLQEAMIWAWQQCLSPIVQRDLLGLAFDAMVEQMMPIVEIKWRQLFTISAIGEKPVLVMYPHGRSGVMLLAVNAEGEVNDEAMVYPFAPDYDAEQTVVQLAKLIIKYNIDDICLVVRPETRKLLLKAIKTLKNRYADLTLKTHLISGDYTQALMQQQVKQPEAAHVVKFAQFLQSPWSFFATVAARQWLPSYFAHLPNMMLRELWQELLLATLYTQGLDINQASKEAMACAGLSAEQIDKLIAGRPYSSRQQIKEVLQLSDERYAYLVGMFRVQSLDMPLDATPVLPEDYEWANEVALQHGVSLASLIDNPRVVKAQDERCSRLKSLLMLKHNKPELLSEQQASDLMQIKSGTCFQGIVTRIMSYGVFVDLGEGVEGLMHISTIGEHELKADLNTLFQPGDVVAVIWMNYDETQKRISLALPKFKAKSFVAQKPKPMEKKSAKQVKDRAQKPQVKKPESPKAPNAMQLAFAKLKQ